jgi:hypothetical protein
MYFCWFFFCSVLVIQCPMFCSILLDIAQYDRNFVSFSILLSHKISCTFKCLHNLCGFGWRKLWKPYFTWSEAKIDFKMRVVSHKIAEKHADLSFSHTKSWHVSYINPFEYYEGLFIFISHDTYLQIGWPPFHLCIAGHCNNVHGMLTYWGDGLTVTRHWCVQCYNCVLLCIPFKTFC